MHDAREVVVLRYGHRPGRDDRMTTHVGLTARALGADRVIFPDNAGQSAETVRDITDRFGGPFAVELRDDQQAIVRDFEGVVAHLTMYGERVQDVEGDVREAVGIGGPDATGGASTPRDLLVVVGGEKVPWALYERADFNVGVTNQPHSEVAGLAVFLDRLFEGAELDREWEDADRRVMPEATGKTVIDADDAEDSDDPGTEDSDDPGTEDSDDPGTEDSDDPGTGARD
ncbi:tRNA (cytidine(56)-2'-O)-methyltransferase [Halorubrum kocurii]|uniref:tRNA (cytidine(56)-2'-O)-methyltransferase n=1 Tax=Halorubrum kocurii JCM 14978 TaxID=1230456 RepID=M0P4P6_9EURY|nr:tRNA (cytidine(56)-2'-O)-methyltransferase [Halorubrum kocurii]EMA64798.1 tRNA 2'-O-methylase [Halorubrum kocurii JCM 14978]